MIHHSPGQPVQFFSRQSLSVLLLFLAATTGVALAELPQSQPAQRTRTLAYQPLSNQPPTVSQSRTLAYEPVTPVAQQRYVANRPVPEPQAGPSTSQSSATPRSSGSRNSRTPDEALGTTLPEPVGQIDDPQIRTALDNISRKSMAAKSGETVPPPNVTTPDNPPTGNEGNTPSTPGTNSGLVFVERIFQDDGVWLARSDGEFFSLRKNGDRYYRADDGREVIQQDDGSAAGLATGGTKFTLADDKTRNAVSLIVTTIALLAAFGVGFLAFDYKHRWEQEIVSQNSRLLGNSVTHGNFTDLDSFEPETLRFSPHDYGSLDDSFDRSFRTIA